MSVDRRHVQLLVANALRMDFRPRGPAGESRLRRARPFASVLLMYAIVGTALGLSLARASIPLFHEIVMLYAAAGMLVVLNLMVEYRDILFSPADSEILGWRPITSQTLYAARALHILAYVTVLTAAQFAVPCFEIASRRAGGGIVVALAFAAGALLNALFVTAAIVLLQGMLLRRLSPERFQDVLGWVQLGFMVSMLLGYQLLTPHLVGTAFGARSPVRNWFLLLPPGWYAALPTLVAGVHDARTVAALACGVLVQGVVWGAALHRLGPGYAVAIENVRLAESAGVVRPKKPGPLVTLFRRGLGGKPLRLLGFDFFLAQLRGDRRIRVGLLPLVAFPVALTLAGLILGAGSDPYDRAARPGPAVRPEPPAALDEEVERERERGRVVLFTAIYTMVALAATLGNSLSRSPDWRAAWVFHAAPIDRYDHFYSGVMWGVVYALLLPAVALLALVLLCVWRDPSHVVAHLTLPAGLAVLGFPLGAALQLELPFAREPLRHSRAAQTALAFVFTVPALVIGALHYHLRDHLPALVAAGILCMALGAAAWRLVASRLRAALRRTAFDG